jgi:hypothetical protein
MGEVPDLSVFWYSHSTICQTLASAFGFLAAVCLYQMQGITSSLVQSIPRLRSHINYRDKAVHMEEVGEFREFKEYVKKHGFISDLNPIAADEIRAMFSSYVERIRYLDVLTMSLRNSLFATAGTILGSLICMALTNAEWVSNFWAAWAMLAVMILATIVCGASYVLLALTVVGETGAINRLERFRGFVKGLPDEPGKNAEK